MPFFLWLSDVYIHVWVVGSLITFRDILRKRSGCRGGDSSYDVVFNLGGFPVEEGETKHLVLLHIERVETQYHMYYCYCCPINRAASWLVAPK